MKKKQISIAVDNAIWDKIETIRCFEVENHTLSYNDVVNILIKEALLQRDNLS